ncbi:Het-C-domain-containing protein [Wolfiporia cocos MD-104 SS10]|uniref:Het-C-domain-containing protein n=1 Tax=Wolfiporia cocos (strain MD-104) TaxID=742152 RepID=A0A2H3IZU8_WOLCO|nr:Het-C-domain-containing protein [Wolfiporia cocos MD-104 SS10]
MVKRVGSGFALGALIGKGGAKFKALDVKRVYFGNWLRDYSQAVDVAGLQKLQLQTIVNLIMVLGFMAHGYATNEFEVTVERLGVYLPTEHIDNPKGYPDNAQPFDRRLRGPVDPRELEIDIRTGMKNYIANEHGSWDTSKALVRRTLQHCIQLGRQHRANGVKADEYEAYRLLGQALHTLEDFTAHSNFCELALYSLSHRNVFLHVGDQVRIQAPDGRWVAPLVTGTFGSSDFIHSLLGEATDHIVRGQASVVDLNSELEKAREKSGPASSATAANTLRELLFKLPNGSGNEMERELEGVERIRAQGTRSPEDMSPQELHVVLWQVLTFRDSVMKKLSIIIDKIPGLGALLEKITDSITVFVFTTLEPFLKPIMKQATTGLQAASGAVINQHDQYEVFDDPRASDPTHSFLSKDHFNLILNEPAGNLGRIILTYTVDRVVKAWDDPSINVHSVTEDILHCLFHPDFHDSNSPIQREMMQYMHSWVQSLGPQQSEIMRRLTKQSVRNHLNVRLGSESGPYAAQGTVAQTAGMGIQQDLLANVPGLAQAQEMLGKISGLSSAGRSSGVFGQGQSLPGMVMAGLGGTRSISDAGEAPVPVQPSTVEYASHEQAQYGAHHNRHGHEHHDHGHAHRLPSEQQASSYYAENRTTAAPSGEFQASGYSMESTYGAQPTYHATLPHHSRQEYGNTSYAPPPGPPPFPEASGAGYAPAYGRAPGRETEPYLTAPGEFDMPGGFAAPSGGPGFPAATPFGNPSFPPQEEQRHPPGHTGGYGDVYHSRGEYGGGYGL